jgi:hypothetical protein
LFDVALPMAVFLIALASTLLYGKVEKRVKNMFEEREFTMRDAVLLVIAMGTMVSVLVVFPTQAILVLFLWVFSVALFMITYLISQRWYLGPVGPAAFLVLYFVFKDTSVWNPWLLDLFAVIFVVFITVYVGSLFTWKTTLAFALLLTIMDVIQVLYTGYMVRTSEKIIGLSLPVFIVLPVVPFLHQRMGLGLGDLFLTGLLSIQATKKYGRQVALISVLSIVTVFAIVESFMLTYFPEQGLPATVMVFGGWLIAVSTHERNIIASDPYLTEITTYTLLTVMGIIGALVQTIWWLFPTLIFSLFGTATTMEYRYRRVKT